MGKAKKIKVFYNLLPEEYYDILSDTEQNLKTNFNCNFYFDIWQTTYYHTVNDFTEIINRYSGSGLRPYLESLNEKEKQEFLNELLTNLKNT